MPLATDPDQTVDVVLPADRDKPAHEQPTFHARVLTARQMQRCSALLTEAVNQSEDEQASLDKLFACYDMLIAGWSRLYDPAGQPVQMGHPRPPEKGDEPQDWTQPGAREKFEPLLDALTESELWALYRHAVQAITARANDLGNSASPSGSGSG